MLAMLPRATLAAVLFCASLFAWGNVLAADLAVPPLKARVTDLTTTLTAEQRAALENKLAAFEQKKGSQIAVLLVPGTQPETIEQYGMRVAEQWKLGRKSVDDGVLLLVAKNDRGLRIEVGRGLEGVLPDAVVKRIIAEEIAPLFRQGNFDGGINAGVDRIIKIIEGEPLPAPRSGASSSGSAATGVKVDDTLTWLAIGAFFVWAIVHAIFGTLLGALVTGVLTGIAAGFLGAGLAGGIAVAVVVFLICLIALPLLNIVGAISGGGGGGMSSGGSWGGGGGDFGGGGASGRW